MGALIDSRAVPLVLPATRHQGSAHVSLQFLARVSTPRPSLRYPSIPQDPPQAAEVAATCCPLRFLACTTPSGDLLAVQTRLAVAPRWLNAARARRRQPAGAGGAAAGEQAACWQGAQEGTPPQLKCWPVAPRVQQAMLRQDLERFTSEAGAPSDWQTLGCYTEWRGEKVRSFQQDLKVDPERRGGWYKLGIVVAKQPGGGLLINTWTVEDGRLQVDRALEVDAGWGRVLAFKVNCFVLGFREHGPEEATRDLLEIMQTLRTHGHWWDVIDAPAQDLGLIFPADIPVTWRGLPGSCPLQ